MDKGIIWVLASAVAIALAVYAAAFIYVQSAEAGVERTLTFPRVLLVHGTSVSIDLDDQFFTYSSDDVVTYSATVDDAFATASVSGSILTITGTSVGDERVQVTATDQHGDFGPELTITTYVRNQYSQIDSDVFGGSFPDNLNVRDSVGGITGHNQYIWIINIPSSGNPRVRQYLGGGEVTGSGFDLVSANAGPSGAWTDGTTLYVTDVTDDHVYAYTLPGGARDTTKEFAITAPPRATNTNLAPSGIWSDGTSVWVGDVTDGTGGRIIKYSMTGTYESTFDLHNTDRLASNNNTHPAGIWSDGTTLWVVDNRDDRAYAYVLSSGARDATKDIETTGGNSSPITIHSNSDIILIGDTDRSIYRYLLGENQVPFLNGNSILYESNSPTRISVPASDSRVIAMAGTEIRVGELDSYRIELPFKNGT